MVSYGVKHAKNPCIVCAQNMPIHLGVTGLKAST